MGDLVVDGVDPGASNLHHNGNRPDGRQWDLTSPQDLWTAKVVVEHGAGSCFVGHRIPI